jgi:uncharacterized protein involved in propanediol utilization
MFVVLYFLEYPAYLFWRKNTDKNLGAWLIHTDNSVFHYVTIYLMSQGTQVMASEWLPPANLVYPSEAGLLVAAVSYQKV